MSQAPLLDRDRIKELFDLRTNTLSFTGGDRAMDPYPRWHELRASGPVHSGTVHELTLSDSSSARWIIAACIPCISRSGWASNTSCRRACVTATSRHSSSIRRRTAVST